jgi:hypothetical protein
MAAAAAPQEGQSLKNVDVRKATNADTSDIIAAVAEGHKASVRPIFLAALKGEGCDLACDLPSLMESLLPSSVYVHAGIGIHLRSIVFAGAACVLGGGLLCTRREWQGVA